MHQSPYQQRKSLSQLDVLLLSGQVCCAVEIYLSQVRGHWHYGQSSFHFGDF